MLRGLALLALAVGDERIQNGGFDAKPTDADPLPGWTIELGATNGAREPLSRVDLDRQERHGGKTALLLSGDTATRGWSIVKQPVEVRPGGTYRLSAWTRTAGVKPNGFGLDNCYVGLFLFDATDRVVGRELAFPAKPDAPWTRQELSLVAPATVRRASVFVFLSMLGELWVDDVALEIEGGEPLPEPEVVFAEGFEKAKRLSSAWKQEVGATNGTGGKDSVVEVDADVGSEGSPRSLRLAGDDATLRWKHPTLLFAAEPGEIYRWSALVRAEDVRPEGPQFRNLHVNLAFLDAKDEMLGKARFGALEPGTFDWTQLAVEAIAPEGAKKVRAGLFLSMSGDAWFDALELTRERGAPPPYSDWETVEREGVVLRYAPGHPRASEMKSYAVRLEQSRRATCDALEVEFADPITVFLYRDLDEGRLLTGGALDFADPENRRVHQRWESTIGHEMVHVIAHNTLEYAGTGLLGEGIAVWLNGQPPQRHHGRAAELLRAGELPSVADLLGRFRELDQGYPAAGSFCGFLLEREGLATFKTLYPEKDPSARLEGLSGQRLEELEPDWHALLAKYR